MQAQRCTRALPEGDPAHKEGRWRERGKTCTQKREGGGGELPTEGDPAHKGGRERERAGDLYIEERRGGGDYPQRGILHTKEDERDLYPPPLLSSVYRSPSIVLLCVQDPPQWVVTPPPPPVFCVQVSLSLSSPFVCRIPSVGSSPSLFCVQDSPPPPPTLVPLCVQEPPQW